MVPLPRRALAEFIGSAFLVAAVIGSGIAASSMSPSDIGLQLFENAAVTAAALIAIILALGPVSGAHLNPVITLAAWILGDLRRSDVLAYIAAQLTGGMLGAIVANLMFELPAIEISRSDRSGAGLLLGEVVATFGLVLVVFGLVRSTGTTMTAFAVGLYIGGAYFFTSSTSFANPAVTVARMFSDTFAGIAPSSVPGFIAAQLIGGLVLGLLALRALYPTRHPARLGAGR